MTTVMGVLFVLMLFTVWVNYGIFNGRRWAFTVTAILCGCGTLGAMLQPSGGAFGTVYCVAMLVYSILRLTAVVGPPPK